MGGDAVKELEHPVTAVLSCGIARQNAACFKSLFGHPVKQLPASQCSIRRPLVRAPLYSFHGVQPNLPSRTERRVTTSETGIGDVRMITARDSSISPKHSRSLRILDYRCIHVLGPGILFMVR